MSRADQGSPYPIDFATALAEALPTDIAVPEGSVLEKLEAYARLLLQWNPRFHLTSIRDPREIVRRHFGEPLMASPFLIGGSTLLDFGTGGGAPGLPLHMARGPGSLVLVECSDKKATFLEMVVDRLAIPGVRVLVRRVRRADELADVGLADAFTFRAVPDPESKTAWIPSLVRPGGVALLFLGRHAADHVEREAPRYGLVPEGRRLLPGARASFLVVLRRP